MATVPFNTRTPTRLNRVGCVARSDVMRSSALANGSGARCAKTAWDMGRSVVVVWIRVSRRVGEAKQVAVRRSDNNNHNSSERSAGRERRQLEQNRSLQTLEVQSDNNHHLCRVFNRQK